MLHTCIRQIYKLTDKALQNTVYCLPSKPTVLHFTPAKQKEVWKIIASSNKEGKMAEAGDGGEGGHGMLLSQSNKTCV